MSTEELVGEALSSGAVGLIGAAVAILAYGSNLVPVKRVETGDGLFFLLMLCSSAWFVSVIIHVLRNCPVFYPLCMLGGFVWASGNLLVIPILKTIGLGPGMLLWSSSSLMIGWATGYFGWFGLRRDQINRPTLNYIGFALALLRLLISVGIKPDPAGVGRRQILTNNNSDNTSDRDVLLTYDQHEVNATQEERDIMEQQPTTPFTSATDASWVDKLSLRQKRVVGCILAILSGVTGAVNFVPCLWIQQNVEGASQNGLDYLFSYCCGMLATGWAWFLTYTAYMQNRPQFPEGIVIPTMVSGTILALGKAGWFIANATLSESVSFPIISTGPSIIGSLWSVFLFREIHGAKNYTLLVASLLVGSASVTLTALSKL